MQPAGRDTIHTWLHDDAAFQASSQSCQRLGSSALTDGGGPARVVTRHVRHSALTAPKGCISLVGIVRTRFPRILRYKPLPSPATVPSSRRDEHQTPNWNIYFCEGDGRKLSLVGIAHCTPDAPTCPLRSTGVVEVLVPFLWRATPPLYSEKIAQVPLGKTVPEYRPLQILLTSPHRDTLYSIHRIPSSSPRDGLFLSSHSILHLFRCRSFHGCQLKAFLPHVTPAIHGRIPSRMATGRRWSFPSTRGTKCTLRAARTPGRRPGR